MTAYYRPDNLEDALDLLHQTEGRVAAGCTDLFPATEAPALSGPIVDITGIPALEGVTQEASGIRIGATTSWSAIIKADLPPAFDMLKEAAREVGSVQIQNAGTLAGNLCNASPAADGVPCLLALDAEVEIAGQDGVRRVPLCDFLQGVRRTVLRPDEIVTAVHVPKEAVAGRSRFRKLGARAHLVISIAMVAVRLEVSAGKVQHAAVAVGSCSAVAERLTVVEQALVGATFDHTLSNAIRNEDVWAALSPISDIRADASYRNVAAAELIRRAVADLVGAEVPA